MLITCPNCQASYTVAESALGEHGRQVRCTKCKEVWFAAAQTAAAVVEEWQPSADEWRPETDQPAAEDAGAEIPVQDPDWPRQEAAQLAEQPRVDDAPPTAPEDVGAEESGRDSEVPGTREPDYDTIRRRKAARLKAQKERGLGITAGRVAAAFAGVIVALVVARENIVRLFPQTASLYRLAGLNVNLRGLEFAGLKTSFETKDGTRVLLVEGDIRNVSNASQPVTNLHYVLRDAAGVDVYTWTGVPDRNVMSPGETTHFRTRLASPPNDGRDVRVSFAPRDAAVPQKH